MAGELYWEFLRSSYCRTWIVIRSLWEMLAPAAVLLPTATRCTWTVGQAGFSVTSRDFLFSQTLDSLISFPGCSHWFLTNFKYFRKEVHSGLLQHRQVPPALLHRVTEASAPSFNILQHILVITQIFNCTLKALKHLRTSLQGYRGCLH